MQTAQEVLQQALAAAWGLVGDFWEVLRLGKEWLALAFPSPTPSGHPPNLGHGFRSVSSQGVLGPMSSVMWPSDPPTPGYSGKELWTPRIKAQGVQEGYWQSPRTGSPGTAHHHPTSPSGGLGAERQ